jgi:hypothetical protein
LETIKLNAATQGSNFSANPYDIIAGHIPK